MAEVSRHILEDYLWREYDFNERVYRIENPVAVYTTPNGTTHRVEDSLGVIHIVPAVGHFGCVLRYEKSAEAKDKVTF